MPGDAFSKRYAALAAEYEALINRENRPMPSDNGMYRRWEYPVLSAAHVPLDWRYDLDPKDNPYLIERVRHNAVFNAGALYLDGKNVLIARIEGVDRKSFFAVAESASGVDGFTFRDYPIVMPETEFPDTDIFNMRVTQHEDGWIYGLFCTERRDPSLPKDLAASISRCAIARTHDLKEWHRLPDLVTLHGQQRNVVLHPEFVNGKYALYTRPQGDFDAIGAGGIGWALVDDITLSRVSGELVIERKAYHTVKEIKNGEGPAPIKTDIGWLHMAHGVRATPAGLRYVLYLYMTALDKPWVVTHAPGGHFIAPRGVERVGDVPNVVFCNGWIARPNGDVFIYYGASDTRLHVATTSLTRLIDYVTNSPPDSETSARAVQQRIALINKNRARMTP